MQGIREFVKDATGPATKQLDFTSANMKSSPEVDDLLEVSTSHDPEYHNLDRNQVKEINLKAAVHVSDIDQNQVDGNPIQLSTPSSFIGREPLLMVSPYSSRPTGANTPSFKLSSSVLLDKYVRKGETPLSLRENISKLKNLGTSPITSSLREGIDRSKSRLSKYSLMSTPVNMKDKEHKLIGNLNAHLENQLIIVTPKNIEQWDLTKMDAHGAEMFMNHGKLSQNKNTVDSNKAGEPFGFTTVDISQDGKSFKSMQMAASPSNMLHSTAKKINFDLENDTVETIEDENVASMHKRYSSPPLELLDQKSSPSLESQDNCFNKLEQLDQQNTSACTDSGHYGECSSPATVAKHLDTYASTKSNSSAFEVEDAIQISKVRRKFKKYMFDQIWRRQLL